MAAYCIYMGRRLAEMRRIMKPDGSIYLHCDPHANAYLRILMDAVFGGQNFRREIVWQMSAASGFKGLAKNFVRGHDTILYYGKSKSPKFNKPWLPYDEKQLARFSGIDENGRKYKSITRTRRLYLDEAKGVPVTDVWGDIANFQTVVNSPEIVGYPTQKPLALLERIIKASSNPGDLVMDPFCGCGTAADAAAALGRGYLGIDISAIAVRVMQQRLESRGEAAAPAVYGLELNDFDWAEFERRALMSRDESEDGIPGWAWAEDKVAGLLNAIPNQRKTGDGGVDARYFGAMDLERNEGVIIPNDEKQLARFSGIDENGRKYKSITRTRRLYLDEAKGVPVTDVWGDIANFQTVVNSPEIVGYPTQKPLALLERIIKASSNPGDLVMDPFCGCGTAADAAAALGRGYLGIDISAIAVRVMQQRLESRGEAAAPAVYGLELNDFDWAEFERRALMSRDESEDGIPGWAWAEDKVAGLLNAIPNQRKTGDGGVDARYFGAMDLERNEGVIIPIQVKMHRNRTSVGRPDLDRLLGTQTAMQNRGLHAPMSLLISLYPPPDSLRIFAAAQGRVTITTREAGAVEYPVMQAISVQEMLQRAERPALPPVDPRSLVGDTQDKMLMG